MYHLRNAIFLFCSAFLFNPSSEATVALLTMSILVWSKTSKNGIKRVNKNQKSIIFMSEVAGRLHNQF